MDEMNRWLASSHIAPASPTTPLGPASQYESSFTRVSQSQIISQSASQKSCLVTNRSQGDLFFRGILSSARSTSSGNVSSERARTHKSCTSSRPGAQFCARARFCPDTFLSGDDLWEGALRFLVCDADDSRMRRFNCEFDLTRTSGSALGLYEVDSFDSNRV